MLVEDISEAVQFTMAAHAGGSSTTEACAVQLKTVASVRCLALPT